MDIRCNTLDHTLINFNNSEPGAAFPFYSEIVALTNSPSLVFSGGTGTVTVYGAGGPNGLGGVPNTPVQTYKFSFPSTTIPMPVLNGGTNAYLAPLIGTGTYAVNPNNSGQTNFDRWRDIYVSSTGTIYPTGGGGGVMTNYIQPGDVVRSLFPNSGDIRMLALGNVPTSAFSAYTNYTTSTANFAHAHWTCAYGQVSPALTGAVRGSLVANADYPANTPFVAAGVNGVTTVNGAPGDWDNGMASYPDGPYINKPDEGGSSISGNYCYFVSNSTNSVGTAHFSPNREIASPVMFGSLSTGVAHQYPWQTLLFRPGPGAAGLTAHPGEAGMAESSSGITQLAGAPPDSLLLDLFWMPIAQPYAISEPFSTAGKVNLNYQIVPFSYITRSTAIRSVLAGEKVAAVPLSQVANYKTFPSPNPGMQTSARLPIDLDQTLSQFNSFFSTNLFSSPSQICNMFLVPQDYTLSAFTNGASSTAWYGPSFALVGDNVRERPYSDIYSRITTKSNTYTVHFTVEALKNPSSDPTQWNENTGVILGAYRGSTTLERYLDPNDPALTAIDFATDTSTNVDAFYKWRVVENDQFAP
jgi:uncharacterized protein (TIGR02600 family)